MRGQRYVLDTVRAMFHWAADAERGNLLPAGFANPFRRSNSADDRGCAQGIFQPDITTEMAVDLLSLCDAFQLPIFATLVMHGLRPGELGWIFGEDMSDGWIHVVGHSELSYKTKGRRDKQFPMLDCLRMVWPHEVRLTGQGLLFHRRMGGKLPSLISASKQALAERFQLDGRGNSIHSAAQRRRARDSVLDDAGQLTYDHIRAEFSKLAKQLHWPQAATVKDFQHLFATGLENAGVPESYRRFFMGHAPGRAAIVTYTHLNKLREHFLRAMDSEFSLLVAAIKRRAEELGLCDIV